LGTRRKPPGSASQRETIQNIDNVVLLHEHRREADACSHATDPFRRKYLSLLDF